MQSYYGYGSNASAADSSHHQAKQVFLSRSGGDCGGEGETHYSPSFSRADSVPLSVSVDIPLLFGAPSSLTSSCVSNHSSQAGECVPPLSVLINVFHKVQSVGSLYFSGWINFERRVIIRSLIWIQVWKSNRSLLLLLLPCTVHTGKYAGDGRHIAMGAGDI